MSLSHSGGTKTIAVALVFCIAALALVLHSTNGRTELLDKLAQDTQELDSESADATNSVKGQVGAEDLARGILSSARKQFQAKKKDAAAAAKAAKKKQIALKKVAAKHAAHRATTLDGFTLDKKAQAQLAGKKASASPPTSSLLKRMPAYLDKKHKESRATKLEAQIANHKLTTRGLIAAVQKAEQHQMHELNDGLKDQTDDLIIAKINQLKHHKAADTQNYVLSNALNKQERSELASGQGKMNPPKPQQVQAQPAQAAPPQQQQQQQQQAAWGAPQGVQRQNQAIVHATAGSKGGNPEGMLSSYDQELLSKGPAGLEEEEDSKAPTNMLSQLPAQQYQQYPSPTAPQYQQAYQYPQQQYNQQYEQQPQYEQPQYPYQQMYQQPPQYEPPAPYQQAYQQYPQEQYEPPAPQYQQAYQYPQEYQQPAPYQQAYQYPQPQYQQPAPYQQMYQQPPAPPAEAPPTPPAPAVHAAVPAASEYGESQAVASHQYNGGSGGGTLWKMFSAGIGGGAPPGGGGGGGGGMGGLSQSGSGLSMGGGGGGGLGGGDGGMSSLSSSLADASDSDSGGGGGLGGIGDPRALLPKGVGTKPTANLPPAAKSAVAAQMQALRESIMDDFHSTTKMGQEAGYLPPPP